MSTNWILFKLFFKASLFTFSGGLAMLPVIQKELIDTHHLLTEEELLTHVSIAQSIPGPIVLDVALFVGKSLTGYMGMFVCATAASIPAFVGMLLIAIIFKTIPQDNMMIHGALNAIKAASGALILSVSYTTGKKILKDALSYVILIASFIMVFILNIDGMIALLSAGIVGILYQYASKDKSKEGEIQ